MNNREFCLNRCQAKALKTATKIAVFLPIFVAILFLCGCNRGQTEFSQSGKAIPKAKVSIDQLQSQLDEFEEVFSSRTKATAAEIDRLSGEPRIMKMTLLWRSRSIAALHNILEQQQPMVVLVDSWLLSIRLTNYIETGEAANIFADYQSAALDSVREIEAYIESIAQNVLSEQLFKKTSEDLHNLALANPIQSGFNKTLMYSTQLKKDQPDLLSSVIGIPLAPVRALEGVDRTSSAIYDFSTTTRRMTDVIQELPDSARWQLLLSLYDLEETTMVRSFLTSLQNIAESSNRLSIAAEQLPAAIADSNESQEQLRQTLAEVNETSVQLRQLFESARETAIAFSQTANDVNMVAVSWADAARATGETIKQFKPEGQTEPDSGMDLVETAQAVREAANEIKLLSEELPSRTEQITAQFDSLTTGLTIKVALLIVLVFCLFVAYFFIRKKSGFPKNK